MATREADVNLTRDSVWRYAGGRAGVQPAPPFRADHAGGLLLPCKLLNARKLFERRVITVESLQEFEDDAIQQVAKYQENLGLQSITDGGFRQRHFHADLPAQLDAAGPRRSAAGQSTMQRDFIFLKSVTRHAPKVAIPAPTMLHFGGGRVDSLAEGYCDLQQFDLDLAAAYANELQLLANAGCTYLQLDDGYLAALCDERERAAVRQRGGDPDQLLLRYVHLINAAIATRPSDMTACLYLCRGQSRESWLGERACEPAVETLFSELRVDGYFLRYDESRYRDFTLLRYVPPAKRVVLGLVAAKAGCMQRGHDLKRSIDAAAKYIPLEQLCLAPQCGFSGLEQSGTMSLEVQSAKLRLVVETARAIWGRE